MTSTVGFRLSPQQRRLIRLGTAAEHISATISVTGPADPGRLRIAVKDAQARNEALRTRFVRTAAAAFPLQIVDAEGDAQVTVRQSAGGCSIDISSSPLCLDAASLGIIVAEIAACYADARADEQPLQYPDAAEWFNEQLEADNVHAAIHWRERPVQNAARPLEGRRAARAVIVLADTGATLLQAARNAGTTAQALTLACWHRVLASTHLDGADLVDVLFDGRIFPDLKSLIGPVEVWTPVRMSYDCEGSFADFASAIDAEFAAAEPHLFAHPSEVPVPRAGFRWIGAHSVASVGETTFRLRDVNLPDGPHEVAMLVQPSDDALIIEVRAASDYEHLGLPEPEVLTNRMASLLQRVSASPFDKVTRHAPLLPPETDRLLDLLNPHLGAWPDAQLIFDRVVAHAKADSSSVAATSLEGSLTYGSLLERSESMAVLLRTAGVEPEEVVAICGDQCLAWLVAVLGVWRAGSSCVSIDSTIPRQRAEVQLGVARVRLALVADGFAAGFDGIKEIGLTDALTCPAGQPNFAAPIPENLAFVTFTSGTTGRPKGVATEHRNLAEYARSIGRTLNLGQGTRIAAVASPTVDLGMTAWLAALYEGWTVAFMPSSARLVPQQFARAIQELGVHALKVTPTQMAIFLRAEGASALPSRAVVFGGEPLLYDLVQQAQVLDPKLAIYNHYGPTETTVGVLTHRIEQPASCRGSVPIGRALPAAHALPGGGVPVWGRLTTELWVGGRTVSRGYYDDPRATAERFVPNPIGTKPGERAYLTGDIIRLDEQARAVHAGRIDDQVKLLGQRVEPGEVTSLLLAQPEVSHAVTLPTGTGVSKRLSAWVVTSRPIDERVMIERLQQALPQAAVPLYIHEVDAIPTTPGGKPDRNALLQMVRHRRPERPPHGAVEMAIASILEELLHVPVKDAMASFFDLGGHSLLATLAIARLRENLGLPVTVEEFFAAPSVAGLATYADSELSLRLEVIQAVAEMSDDEVALELSERSAP